MKLLSVIFLFLGSVSLCFAASDFRSDETLHSPSLLTFQGFEEQQSSQTSQEARQLKFAAGESGKPVICYKIRSYHVIREGQDSDVTRPDGYSTCQFATQFAVKKATAPAKLISH